MGMRSRQPASQSVVRADPSGGAALKEVSWREVARHNTKDDCWLTVKDTAYDLTDYISKHPGGEELMLTFAGREATYAFEAYHALSLEVAREKLRHFAVAKVIDSEFQRYPAKDTLYDELRTKVKAYFVDNKVDPKQWTSGIMHFLFMLMIAAASLSVCFGIVPMSTPFQLLAAVVFGWIQGMYFVLFCIRCKPQNGL